MPTVQSQLVDRGVTFENAFVVNPVCCPSRASTLTGRYSHSTGVYNNNGPYGGWPSFRTREGSTIATWLEGGGYRTGFFGKYLNNYGTRFVPPGWSRWVAFAPPNTENYYTLPAQHRRNHGRLRERPRRLFDRRARRRSVVIHPRRRHRAALRPLRALRAARAPDTRAPARGRLRRSAAVAAGKLQRAKRRRQAGLGAVPRAADDRGRRGCRRLPPWPAGVAPGGGRRGRRPPRRARGHRPARRDAVRVHVGQRLPLGRAPLALEDRALRRVDPCAARRPLRRGGAGGGHEPSTGGEHRPRADLRPGGGRRSARRGGPELPEPPPQPERGVATGCPRGEPQELDGAAGALLLRRTQRGAHVRAVRHRRGGDLRHVNRPRPAPEPRPGSRAPPVAGLVPTADAGALQPPAAGDDASQPVPHPR